MAVVARVCRLVYSTTPVVRIHRACN
jgi:hypothetical protein